MKKALITGVSGFAGSFLTEHLLEKKIRVSGIYVDEKSLVNLDKIKNVNVGRKTALRNALILVMIQQQPLSFIDNSPIDIEKDPISTFNDSEKHHIFPRKFLTSIGIKEKKATDLLVNLCLIDSQLNKLISGTAPREYFLKFDKQNHELKKSLNSHLIPADRDSAVWKDDYKLFIDQRAEILLRQVKKRIGDFTATIEEQMDTNPVLLIQKLEQAIRETINNILYDSIGENWWEQEGVIPQDVKNYVADKIKKERANKPYIQKTEWETPLRRLEQVNIMDYLKIILTNWNLFEDIFGSKEQLDKHFKSLKEYRNSIKHARKINDIERKEGEIALQWLLQSLAKQDELGDNSIQEVINDTEERHLIRPTGDIKEVYDKLKANIQILGNDIEISPQKHYIAFKRKGHSNRNFLSLKLHKNQIKLYLPIEKEKINDPKKLARDVSSIGHHGTGRYEIIINSTKDLDYITGLIKQSYSESSSIIASEIDRNFHLNKIKKQNIHSRAEGLIKRILEISDDIQEHYSQSHIKFRRSVDFCLIYCQKNQFWVDVKLNRKEIKSQGLDIREHKDEKWTHIRVHEDTDLDEILRLIKIAEGKE